MKKINKENLSDEVASRLGISKKDGNEITRVVFEVISDFLIEGKPVGIRGFGFWRIGKQRERKGINPQTLKPLWLPKRKTVLFKSGKTLKKELNTWTRCEFTTEMEIWNKSLRALNWWLNQFARSFRNTNVMPPDAKTSQRIKTTAPANVSKRSIEKKN